MTQPAAVMIMPAPEGLLAPAVWVTAQNWAMAMEERFGSFVLCLPGRTLNGADALGQHTRPTGRAPASGTARLRELRTLAKDLRLARTRRRAAEHYRLPLGCRPAIIWQHHDLFLHVGHRLSRQTGAPLVQFVDAPQVWEARSWGVRRPGWGPVLERFGEVPQLHSADAVACVSHDVARASVSLGVDESKVLVTPCTADGARFHPQVDGRQLRRRLGFEPAHVVFGWSGSFRRFHGLDDVVSAFEHVAAVEPSARLLLVGAGAELAKIRDDVQNRGLADKVVFTGAVPHDVMPEHVAAMDIALVAAAAEAAFHYSPLKLREYLAAARPVIAPDAGQVADDFRNGEELLLYTPGDVGGLARAMCRLAADRDQAQLMGQRARARELAQNSASKQVDAVLSVLAGAVGRSA